MVDRNANIIIKVSDNRLRASANFEPALGEGDNLSVNSVIAKLNDEQVTFGIKRDVIEFLCSSEKPLRNIIIAEGVSPGTGERARIETYFDANIRRKALERDDGSVDYRELGKIASASKGIKLYRKIPPTVGTPGTDVSGNEIPGILGKDLNIVLGKGTVFDPDDPDLVVADMDGEIIVRSGVVHISQVHVVQGDVDFSTGNIKFNGSVKIGGTVKSGFKIESEGDIEIRGNVEDAVITAVNDVIVLGGFTGTGEGIIRAGRDVIVKFIENQRIEAERDIIINGESYHSQLLAGRSILGKSGKSMIVGGRSEAKVSIEATKFGAVAATATLMKVGIDPKLADKIKNTEQMIEQTRDSLKKLEQSVIFLYKLKIDNNGILPPEKADLLAKLEHAKESIPQKLTALEKRMESHQMELKESCDAFATADVAVFPKVRVYIGNQWLTIEDTLGPSTFRLFKGEIVRLSK